MDVNEESR